MCIELADGLGVSLKESRISTCQAGCSLRVEEERKKRRDGLGRLEVNRNLKKIEKRGHHLPSRVEVPG